jgi:hypothetical protein
VVTAETFFVNSAYFGEVLTPQLIGLPPARLTGALLAGTLVYGIERVERAVHATYPPASAGQIIAGVNCALAGWQETTGANLDGVR